MRRIYASSTGTKAVEYYTSEDVGNVFRHLALVFKPQERARANVKRSLLHHSNSPLIGSAAYEDGLRIGKDLRRHGCNVTCHAGEGPKEQRGLALTLGRQAQDLWPPVISIE